jgi:hypothetical protein
LVEDTEHAVDLAMAGTSRRVIVDRIGGGIIDRIEAVGGSDGFAALVGSYQMFNFC